MIAPTQPNIVSCSGIGKHGEYRGEEIFADLLHIITTNVSVSAADIIISLMVLTKVE